MVCTPVALNIHTCIIFVVLALMNLTIHFPLASASRGKIGVDYGLNGDNLLTPEQTVVLLCSKGIKRVRIYEARPDVTEAFANSGMNLMIGVPNEDVPKIASNLGEAFNWVTKHVVPFPTSGISAIIVGNEWLLNASNDPAFLVPAMRNIHTALSTLQFIYIYLSWIKVSTSHSFNVLSSPSFPPSTATFAEQFVAVMRPLLDFLDDTDSFFMVNIFPFFAYLADEGVSLDFALFTSTEVVTDPNTGLNYTNLFDLQLDAVYAAIHALSSSSPPSCACNSSKFAKASDSLVHVEATSLKRASPPKRKPSQTHVTIGETGWSSGGGSAHTPPVAAHPNFLPSKHSISALSSTPMSSSYSYAHAHRNHPANLQNTTLSRSANLPSTKLTSFSSLSPSSSPHNFSTHIVPSGLTHAFVPSLTMTSPLPSSPMTSPVMPSSPMASPSLSSMTSSLLHAPKASYSDEHLSSSSPSTLDATNIPPTEKDVREASAATVENARTYNQNLIRHVLQAKGTPANPKVPIQAFIFEIFNEDLKPPGVEQHFGLFFPNGTAVYPINFHDKGKR